MKKTLQITSHERKNLKKAIEIVSGLISECSVNGRSCEITSLLLDAWICLVAINLDY